MPVLYSYLYRFIMQLKQLFHIFKRKTYWFYLLLRNCYSHTFTCVFEVRPLSRSFSSDSDDVSTYFISSTFYLRQFFIQLLK
jgi:hypothetical protein